MLTEQDLQSVLRAFEVDNAPDAAAARRRLDASLPEPGRHDGHWKQRAIGALAAAACIGAVFLGGKAITHDRGASGDRPGATYSNPAVTVNLPPATVSGAPTMHRAVPLPAPPVVDIYPGTRHIASFSGTGSRRVAVAHFELPKDFYLDVTVSCNGAATAEVLSSTGAGNTVRGGSPSDCGIGSSVPGRPRWVEFRVASTATWTMSLDVQPDARTNGAYGKTGLQSGATTTGRGERTVRVPRPRLPAGERTIALTCTGTGVRITSTTGALDGKYTHTCFPGTTYQWNVSAYRGTATITVHASTTTSWRLALDV